MTLEPSQLRTLISALSAPSPRDRELAAEQICDWLPAAFDPASGAVLSRALEAVLALEDSDKTMEAQLNALAEISAHGLAPADVIARVVARRTWEQPWASEYIDGLREDLPYAPQ